MGKSSGSVRGGSKLNAEIQWRVRQTQAEYDRMSPARRTAAINTLRDQYNRRKKAIDLIGSDSSDEAIMRATEHFFRRNKLKL